jgi:hypothetical protein
VVSVRALVCRRCGKRQRMNPRTAYLGLGLLFLGGLFAFAGVGSLPSFGRPVEALPFPRMPVAAAPAAAARAPGGEPQRVSASQIWAAYNKDSVAADHQFKDRPVMVTGTVISAPAREFHGNIVLRLGTGDVFEAVRVMLAVRDATVVSGIVKGQTITVSCVGRGVLIGAPMLDGCRLVP